MKKPLSKFKKSRTKTISLVIPFHNNATTLSDTMHHLRKISLPKGLKLSEVIFVNDGSTDETLFLLKRAKTTILRPFRKTFPKTAINLITYRNTQGRGFAIKQGMLSSTAEYTISLDPSMRIPFTELEKCISSMHQHIGIIKGKTPFRSFGPGKISFAKEKFTNKITKFVVTDFQTGFYAFSQKAKDSIFSKTLIHGWGYEAEIAYLIKQHGMTKKEIVLKITPATFPFLTLLRNLPAVFADLIAIKWHHEWKQKGEIMMAEFQTPPHLLRITSRFSK